MRYENVGSDFFWTLRQRLKHASANKACEPFQRLKWGWHQVWHRLTEKRKMVAALERERRHRRDRDLPNPDPFFSSQLDVGPFAKSLVEELVSGMYRPDLSHCFQIRKRGGSGLRQIFDPSLKDRVIQRALLMQCGPLMDQDFEINSWGSRPNRGVHGALALARHFAKDFEPPVLVKADIRNCFPSVRRRRLAKIISKRVPDDRVVKVLQRIVSQPMGQGILQGHPIAPLLANLFLDEVCDKAWRQGTFDGQVKMVRYVDDILLLGPNKGTTIRARTWLERHLRTEGLLLKPLTSDCLWQRRSRQPLEWLGFGIEFVDGLLVFSIPEHRAKSLRCEIARIPATQQVLDELDQWFRDLVPYYAPTYENDVDHPENAALVRIFVDAGFTEAARICRKEGILRDHVASWWLREEKLLAEWNRLNSQELKGAK